MTDSLRDTLQAALGAGFRIERELGGGGMSRVFVARDLALDRDVVVKVLDRESTAGVSGDRFRREIQVIARLQHPHIMPILSAGSANGALYYVMPFMGGETLRARLSREGPMAVADAARVLREVLDALAFAHKHGVIHRDIKPENVLVEAGHAVVADFGIAKALRESGTMTSAGVSVGTPAYMAPEQATADPTADHRVDLYAIGIMAWELLVGTPPFTGSMQQIITAHLTTPPAPVRERRSDVPEAISQLIARALAKEPSERPQSAGEMIAALDAAVTPTAFTQAPSGVLTTSATRRRVPWRAVAGIGAAAVVVALGTVAWQSRSTRPMVAEGADLIAVMPLGSVSDTSLARLGQDLVVTLSANLDGVGSLRTIDAVTLLMRARKLPAPLSLAEAQRLARELGARSVLHGTLHHEGTNTRAQLGLYPVDADSALARASVLAGNGQIAALTDTLTWEILRQVWRRGAPPSPVLTGLMTSSMSALRSFLDGERHFQRLDIASSLAAYRRAFELDSNFVQAFLRYDYVNEWNLQAPDAQVRSRLRSLLEKLPEREQLWVETRDLTLTFVEELGRWRDLARRYPDYPLFLMAAADMIIHRGPLYGIPLAEARPLLDRLDQLVPDHADTKFHIAIVAQLIGTPEDALAAAQTVARISDNRWGSFFAWSAEVLQSQVSGKPLPPAQSAFPLARTLASEAAANPFFAGMSGTLGIPGPENGYRVDIVKELRKAGIYDGELALASSNGEGLLQAARGDWLGGLEALKRAESSSMPIEFRLSAARVAAIGAWLSAVDPNVADSTLQRVRRLRGAEESMLNRIELRWLDGLIGVAGGDSARVHTVIAQLKGDTARTSGVAARSLDGLWRNRANPDAAADSLRALTEETIRDGIGLLGIEAVNRLVVARSLRQRGSPREAERYLMWVDAGVNSPANMSVRALTYPFAVYERGVALDEAGEDEAAAYQLRRVLTALDMPPEVHQSIVDDTKRRLSLIEQTDAPPRQPVGGAKKK